LTTKKRGGVKPGESNGTWTKEPIYWVKTTADLSKKKGKAQGDFAQGEKADSKQGISTKRNFSMVACPAKNVKEKLKDVKP